MVFKRGADGALLKKIIQFCISRLRIWPLSLFEKVILVNSVMLIGEALAGWWVTTHNLESHHFIIDTAFIVAATLLTLFTNIFLLRMSFRPLFGLLTTIRSVSAGETQSRSVVQDAHTEIGELGIAFNTMLDRLEELRHEQAAVILQAQEDERRRIALELHDETGQNLTALLIHIEILGQSLTLLSQASVRDEARQALEQGLHQLTSLTQQTLENVRVLAQQLRPSVLDDLGMLSALRWLVEDGAQRLQLAVELEIAEGMEELLRGLPATYETAIFRIAQEGLTNTARHAHARRVVIVLTRQQGGICLAVGDDGCGYAPSQQQRGLGIFGMRERAVLLGGTLSVQSVPGKGTTIMALLPLPSEEQAVPKLVEHGRAQVETQQVRRKERDYVS